MGKKKQRKRKTFNERWAAAVEEGRAAFRRGEGLETCPYETSLKGAWLHGWKDESLRT